MKGYQGKRYCESPNLLLSVLIITLIGTAQIGSKTSLASAFLLPSPRKESDVLLDAVLSSDKHLENRTRITDAFKLKTISQLVWSVQGITHPPSRSVPSAGATYPLDVFASIQSDLDEIKQGTYRYHPINHKLSLWEQQPDYNSILDSIVEYNSHISRSIVETAPILFLITAEYERTTAKYGDRGRRYVHLEVGHLLQNLRIQAKALQVDLDIVLQFGEESIQSLYGIEYVPLAFIFAWETSSLENKLNIGKIQEYTTSPFRTTNIQDIQTTASVEAAINARRSIREYLPDPIDQTALIHLLQYSIELRTLETDKLIFDPFLNETSMQTYISISNVKNMEKGVYQYNSYSKNLRQLTNESHKEELWRNSLKQSWILDGAAVIVLCINQSQLFKSNHSYSFNYRRALFDTGATAQNLYLECYALNLGMVVVGAFFDIQIQEVLSLSSEEIPIYVIPVGKVKTKIAYGPLGNLFQLISSISAWVSMLFLYLAHIFLTPVVRKKITRKKTIWIHVILSLIAGFSSFIHLFLSHGGWDFIFNPNLESFKNILQSIFLNLSIKGQDLPNVGFLISRLSLWLSILFIFSSIFLLCKKINWKYKKSLKVFHKYFGYVFLGMMLFHGLVNGSLVQFFKPWGIVLLCIMIATYLFVLIYPKLKQMKK